MIKKAILKDYIDQTLKEHALNGNDIKWNTTVLLLISQPYSKIVRIKVESKLDQIVYFSCWILITEMPFKLPLWSDTTKAEQAAATAFASHVEVCTLTFLYNW